jgi:ATP phosphoribosyltransferase regulatory subunit HisZ
VNRESVFIPCLHFENFKDLNAHLSEQMILEAHKLRHPEYTKRSVYEVYEEEKPYLCCQGKAFDGYATDERRAGVNCLVRFDGNN